MQPLCCLSHMLPSFQDGVCGLVCDLRDGLLGTRREAASVGSVMWDGHLGADDEPVGRDLPRDPMVTDLRLAEKPGSGQGLMEPPLRIVVPQQEGGVGCGLKE